MGACICSGLGLQGEAEKETGFAQPPRTTWALDCEKLRDPAPRVGKGTVCGPRGTEESGSISPAPQTLLGTVEEPVLGSLGHMEARDIRFSVLDIPDAAVCHGRAEIKEGTLWRTLVHGLKGKGLKQSSGRLPWGGESLVSSGSLLCRWLGLVAAIAGM